MQVKITWRRVLAAGLLLVCAAAGAFALRGPILTLVGRFLVVQNTLRQADVIFLHTGDVSNRPPAAAKLLKQGFGQRIVIARSESPLHVQLGLAPNSTDLSIQVLLKLGVPAEKIVELPFPGGVTSSYDEALALRDYADTQGVRSVIVVTSAVHTRRSAWILERVLRNSRVELIMHPVADHRYAVSNWWTHEAGLTHHVDEYLKLAHYWLKY